MPESWAWCRLGQLTKIQSSKRVFEKDYVSSGIPFYRSKEIGILSRNEIIRDCLYISKDHYEILKSQYGVPKTGDILITSVGSIGNTWICDEREFYYKDGNLTQIVKNDFFDSYYMNFFLQSNIFSNQVFDTAAGSAYNALTIEKLNKILFPLPPINEQKVIISNIRTLFAEIDYLDENKLGLQTAIKQAKSKILDLAIHGKLVPQDPNDEPAEELLKRIATSDNRPYEKLEESQIECELPDNWSLCHLGDIITVINGRNQKDVVNPEGKYPIYGSGGIMGYADDYICPENCTIIGRKGSINNPIFVKEKFWNVDTAFGLSPSDAILPKYLFYFCEYFDFTSLDSSTTLPSLTKTNIQQIVFALPPLQEQERILGKIETLFSKLDEIVLNLI